MRQESGGTGEPYVTYGNVIRTRPVPVVAEASLVQPIPVLCESTSQLQQTSNTLMGSQSSQGARHVNHVDAHSKAHALSQYVQNVENETHAIAEDNARLKAQLIAERRGTLEKYFAADDQLLKQMIFGEWKVRLEALRREKRLAEAENFRKTQRAKFTHTIQELERALLSAHHEKQVAQDQLADTQRAAEEIARKLDQSHQRREQLRDGLADEEYFLTFLKGCLDRRARQLNPQAFRNMPASEVTVLKDLIHAVLARIDPGYKTPPVLVKEIWHRVEPPTLVQQAAPIVEGTPVTGVIVEARCIETPPVPSVPVPSVQLPPPLPPQQVPQQQLQPQMSQPSFIQQRPQQGYSYQQVNGQPTAGVCKMPPNAAQSAAAARMRSASPGEQRMQRGESFSLNIPPNRQGTPVGHRVMRR